MSETRISSRLLFLLLKGSEEFHSDYFVDETQQIVNNHAS